MGPDDVMKLVVIFALVVVPALGITVRFALKPIVDAILRLKEGGVLRSYDPGATTEVRQLREEVAELQRTIRELKEVESFHRTLAAPPAPGPSRDE